VRAVLKWLKQHLRIKEFYDTSENAVKIQIYVAIIAYCLVAIVQSELKLKMDTYDMLRILNVSLLTRMPLVELLTEASKAEVEDERSVQLMLDYME
jgi:IS4 transposase